MSVGPQYFSWFDIIRTSDEVPFEKKWGAVSRIVAEIDSFASILLSNEGAAPPVTMSIGAAAGAEQSPGWLAARARWAALVAELGPAASANDYMYYLFVVNDGNGGGLVTFTLDKTVADIHGGVEVVSESPPRKLDLQGKTRSFSDNIEQLDVKVYKFTPKKISNL